nr:hypothetical protein [uncultured bacterium]
MTNVLTGAHHSANAPVGYGLLHCDVTCNWVGSRRCLWPVTRAYTGYGLSTPVN